MKLYISTHDETLINPIVELDKTIDYSSRKVFVPVVILIDRENERRRFGQFLPEQPYVNDSWTDEDVQNAISEYIKSIEVK